jgi:fermentation-respiration switch protein FrsA (DUF1100 family)
MKCSNPDCNRGIGLIHYRREWFSTRRYCSRNCRDFFVHDVPKPQQNQSATTYFEWRGEAPGRQAIVSADAKVAAAYRTQDAIDFYLQPPGAGGRWENVVTTRSTRMARMYEPGVWVSRIAPTPLLMVVARHDTITLTDLALEAYERAHEPKKLVTIPGGHFDPYLSGFDVSSRAAVAWFKEHLTP